MSIAIPSTAPGGASPACRMSADERRSSVPTTTASSSSASRSASRVAAFGAFALCFVAATALAARRLAGGFAAPDSALPAIVAGTAFCALAWALATVFRRTVQFGSTSPATGADCGVDRADLDQRDDAMTSAVQPMRGPAAVAVVAHLPALIIGLALLPERPAAALAALAFVLTASGHAAYRRLGGAALLPAARRWMTAANPARAPAVAAPAFTDFERDPNLAQWMRRRRVEGVEVVEAGLRVEFLPGRKQAAAHVPFVPPLAGIPAVDCEADDTSVRLKVGAAYSYGLRIDARRAAATDQPATTVIFFTARSRGECVAKPQA